MKRNKFHYTIVILCIATFIFSIVLTPTKKYSEINPITLIEIIPEKFDDWHLDSSISNMIKSPEQDAIINRVYSQVIARTYINKSGSKIMLSIAYTDNQTDNAGKQSHKPEVCYPAQGFNIIDLGTYSLNTKFGNINTKHLVANLHERIEPITYWTMVGNKVVNNDFQTKLAQIGYGFNGFLADGLVFRISNIADNYEYSYDLHKSFITQLINNLSVNDRKRLMGI